VKSGEKWAIRLYNRGFYPKENMIKNKLLKEKIIINGIYDDISYFNTDTGHMIYKYIEGNTLTLEDLYDDKIRESHMDDNFVYLVAKEMKRMHNISFSVEEDKIYRYEICESERVKSFDCDQKLKDLYIKLNEKYNNSDVVLCHCDPHTGNIVYNREKQYVRFIDFELAGLRNKYWDLLYFLLDTRLIFDEKKKNIFLTAYGIGEISGQIVNEITFLYAFCMTLYKPTGEMSEGQRSFCKYCEELLEKSLAAI
jgi:thiamine kinase-like enzyme